MFDTSAVLAWLRQERGADVVEVRLADAQLCTVNLAEVVSKLADFGLPDAVGVETVANLGMKVVPFGEALAMRTGQLRAVTRTRGLSLGDRACIALAEAAGLPILTADRIWAELDLGVEVVLIR